MMITALQNNQVGWGKVDSNDESFNKLKVWHDKDSDGKLDDSEFLSLTEVSIQSLNTTYKLR